MDKKNHLIRSLILFGVMLILFCADVTFGSVPISFTDFFNNLFSESNSSIHTIVWQFRLPKAITCVLAGASLACSGLMMQTLFRNPLVGPDVLGLTSGASLTVGMLLLTGRGMHFSSNEWTLAIAAGGGSILVMLLMLAITQRIKDNASLLIIGLMLAASTSSIMSVMQFVSRAEDLQFYFLWTMGNIGNTGWSEIGVLFLVVFIGVAISFFLLKPLNTWLLGENYAKSLGINVSRSRIWIVIASGLMTGAITAFCGPIAFVGLAVPHLARLVMQTSNHKILLPAVLFSGSILLLFCDFLSQLMSATQAVPLNALTSLIGAPIVIWQVMKFKKINV